MVMNNSMFITANTACLPESSCYIISVYLHNKLDAGMLQPIDCCRDRGGEEERRSLASVLVGTSIPRAYRLFHCRTKEF